MGISDVERLQAEWDEMCRQAGVLEQVRGMFVVGCPYGVPPSATLPPYFLDMTCFYRVLTGRPAKAEWQIAGLGVTYDDASRALAVRFGHLWPCLLEYKQRLLGGRK